MIFRNAIFHWRTQAPWLDDAQVEQDLILSALVAEIYSDEVLAASVAFRGGTCLNKLFWERPTRYSEGIDLVQIEPGKIGNLVNLLRNRIDPLFGEKPSWEKRRNVFRLFYSFQPEMGGAPKNIKIEINTREHFSVEGFVRKKFELKSLWKNCSAEVTTYSLNELLATKLRALYQRRKGRDLYDLWKARHLKPDWQRVVDVFLEYMKRESKKMTRDEFLFNIEDKIKDRRFLVDTQGLLMTEEKYDPVQAVVDVKENIVLWLPSTKRSKRKSLL
jgi:predicted nucleotidyltransferase component of viral defense system